MSSCHRRGSARSEFARTHGRDPARNVSIVDVREVGEPSAGMQRSDPAKAVDLAKPVEADHAEAPTVATPPREEAVTRPDWQPPEAAPSAPSETKAPPTSEAEERHICRRPERTIESRAPHRSGPPRPRAAVRHPTSVVIWRPAPRLIANPSPTVVRLIRPVAVAIGSPAIRLIRHPDLAVVRGVLPCPVGIQVFRSNVILVRVMPCRSFVNHAITIAIPAVPIVAVRSRGDFVLGIGAGAAYRRHLTLLNLGNPLWGRDLRLALAGDDDAVPIGPNFNAEYAIFVRRMQRDVGRVDLRLSFTFTKDGVIGQALSDLNLNVLLREVRDVGLGIRSQAKNVGVVELYLRSPARSSGNFIAVDHGLIQDCRRPRAGIPALRRDVAMNHADAAHTSVGLCRAFPGWSAGLSFFSELGRRTGLGLPRLRWLSRLGRRTRLRGLRLSDFHRRLWLLSRSRTGLGSLGFDGERECACQRQS